jgi:cephalosporin hydroxylase
MTYFDITGWSTLPEIYPHVAFYVGLDSSPAKFVEVGVAYGRSIAYLADQLKLANRKDTVEIFAVDIWASQNQYNIFSANMYTCGIRQMVKPIRTYSHMASLGFADQSLDFVYIDGDHRLNGVMIDIESWFPKIKTNGYLSGHDIHLESVRRGVDNSIGLKNCQIWGKSWVYHIPGE